MLDFIRTFCCFSLAACTALLLLPEGSLRKTASLSFGLMLSLLWMDSLLYADVPAPAASVPSTALSDSGTTIDQASVIMQLQQGTALPVR